MNVDISWIAAQFPELSDLQPLAQGGQKVVFAARHAIDGIAVIDYTAFAVVVLLPLAWAAARILEAPVRPMRSRLEAFSVSRYLSGTIWRRG